jgi:hypothetical protein
MTITIADLTANVDTSPVPDLEVTGDGILDDIMETANKHLSAQFTLGRITGVEYSKVYLGVMQAALAQSVAFTLGKAESNAQVDLTFQKEVTEFAQTEQLTKIAPASTSVLGVQSSLITQQEASLVTKTTSEASLLLQKEITEFAQTDQATKIAPTATSIMGAQALLSIEQAKGFKWNADQKYLKTLLDAWSINISTAGVAATGVAAINEIGVGNINTQISNAEPAG